MARKKQSEKPKKNAIPNAYIAGAGIVEEEKITDTLEKNYMPYAMSVIISRALPEIDGFKPSHRKLLYTMYKMGLLTGGLTKSANVVGQTMRLNPHGDSAIYETMVRLARGNEALLHPYVQSKGNFGKAYSKDMAYAASRYTEVKLEPICNELFRDIDKDTVDFVPNYDNTMQEPTLFPATFPTVLVNANVGIAVSMASSVCPFNLAEVCETTIAVLKNPEHDILSTLKGPDFPGGGFLFYNETELQKIYDTGRGSVTVRAKWNYNKQDNCLEVTEIPYSTTIEAIKDKIVDCIKQGKLREVSYVRDETDIDGLKIAIDLKRGSDPEKVMQKLFRMTPLQDNYSCNFNILVGGAPRVMGVREILEEWSAFRLECVRRRLVFDLQKKQEKLHLLLGLEKILLNIDKAIRIVRETVEETDVVPNLMIGFGIDEIQAEYVAEIKLRHLNREYILKRTQEIDQLKQEIAELEETIADPKKMKKIIIAELKETAKKYGQPRKTLFYYASDIEEEPDEEDIPDYPVHLFLSQSGYFKKITPASLRMSSEQKLKEEDQIVCHLETTNCIELLFFTNQQQVYKTRASDFTETKASVMGDYIPAKLGFADGEFVVQMIATADYQGDLLFVFANGKAARVPMSAYATKTNRKKLQKAYSDRSPLVQILQIPSGEESCSVFFRTDGNRAVLADTALISAKSTRDTQGVQVVTLKAKHLVCEARVLNEEECIALKKYRVKTIPATGGMAKDLPESGQLSLL
ncbi:DNA topoisomerase (ATP-hydrolyzing) subunit A [uncultured Ruminococcus sp.]|uniref:DNA gyrase/topoisomerase IV subunit A n=1 Tax=uncultured Ruminococcus sp. TaxID=165186 RepID=UPI002598A1BA|nr:DNA topoisomerase (ATP-hydrolyzing) subunit A [uncultured Ruminococcus sp.]